MVSVVLVDTVNAKARLTSTMISILLASTCGDPKTIQVSSSYSMPYITTLNDERSPWPASVPSTLAVPSGAPT